MRARGQDIAFTELITLVLLINLCAKHMDICIYEIVCSAFDAQRNDGHTN